MWERAFEVERRGVGLDKMNEELAVIDSFIEYVLSCLKDPIRTNIEYMMSRLELGLKKGSNRLGVLLSEHLIDARPGEPANEAI
jgi:hypothetical protein